MFYAFAIVCGLTDPTLGLAVEDNPDCRLLKNRAVYESVEMCQERLPQLEFSLYMYLASVGQNPDDITADVNCEAVTEGA